MENTSGHGVAAVIPAELDRWNWGAFLLNWIWGIGNNTFIALLMFVPVVNMVMPFVLGAKGSAWAWRNKRWDSVEHFRRVQRLWAIWGVVFVIALVGFGVAIWFSVMALLKHSEPYQMAVARLQANAEAVSALGTPITTGYPTGRIETSGSSGSADFAFSVEGPKGKGMVYLHATKDLGAWRLDRIELQVDGRAGRINLGEGNRVDIKDGSAALRLAEHCNQPAVCLKWAFGLH
jgi:Cytochrome oxidase complex assembly protein 1